MVESLRGLGYSPATALADIIDNSIAADADSVQLLFHWDGGNSYIAVRDNGRGMDDAGVESAMRLGDRNPLDERAAGDLGRFGLGLKTASFSQARALTLSSQTASGDRGCLRWDLDALADPDNNWDLLEGPAARSEDRLHLPEDWVSGTVVLWEKLDRIVTRGFGEQDMLDLIDVVERHLAMTFHRYLEGSAPRLFLTINRQRVRGWDPFMTNHSAKAWTSPIVEIAPGSCVVAQCHVLPHQDRLDLKERESAGGPEGWTSQQGFYVYRNERLLVAGSWLGLGPGRAWTRDEAHRLARIRLDIPNSADAEWKLDIRKSTARPPVWARTQLTRLAEDTRRRARRVFAHRGRLASSSDTATPTEQAWEAIHGAAGIRYRISRSHSAIRWMLEDAGERRAEVEAILRIVEETVPVQRIWLDTAEGRETPRTGFEGQASTEVVSVLEAMFRNMILRRGLSPDAARQRLVRMQPFCDYPALVAALPDELRK
jgi:hypothetical protein